MRISLARFLFGLLAATGTGVGIFFLGRQTAPEMTNQKSSSDKSRTLTGPFDELRAQVARRKAATSPSRQQLRPAKPLV